GVASALVSLEAQHASVRWAAGTEADVAAVVQAVRVAGYEARAIEGQSGSPTTDAHARQGIWSYNFWFGMVPTALLLSGDWLLRLAQAEWYRWVSLALAAVVQFGPGRQFYRGAWSQLKAGRVNM